jgi:hypothetical protein
MAAASSASGGELFDTSPWKNHPPTAIGSVPFDDLMSFGLRDQGAYIAYVDLFGTATSLSIYTSTSNPDGGINGPIGRYQHLVATSSETPQQVDGGWTRFSFRDLKLPVFSERLFEGGAGPSFRIQDGSFSIVKGFTQDPNPPLGSAQYFEVDTGIVPQGPVPVFRVIWETLDAPYVLRLGDANRDDVVNLTDFGLFKKHLGSRVDPFTVADFNGDGAVNGPDFTILRDNFGWKASAAAPEPATGLLASLSLLHVAALGAVRRMRKASAS